VGNAAALYNGAVTTYHATVVDHWTCKNGQNEGACRANTDTRTRTVSTLNVYDGKDQLRRATKKNSANFVQGSEEYWYDPFGQRIAIVKRDAVGAKTEMIWFIGDTEAHYDAEGKITHIYSHLSMGTPIARVDRTNDTTAVEYQFHGVANNTISAVDQGGTINASFSYAPFGEIIEATNGGGTGSHRRRLNDKYVDEISELAYYGARYYDKTLVGWTQGDRLFRFAPDAAGRTPRRASEYEFSLNNPLRYIDPDGRDTSSASMASSPWSGLSNGHWTANSHGFGNESSGSDPGAPDVYVEGGNTATNLNRQKRRNAHVSVIPVGVFRGDRWNKWASGKRYCNENSCWVMPFDEDSLSDWTFNHPREAAAAFAVGLTLGLAGGWLFAVAPEVLGSAGAGALAAEGTGAVVAGAPVAQKLFTQGEVRLLSEFFGNSVEGAWSRALYFQIPENLTTVTLQQYAIVAQRAIDAGKDTLGVQQLRLDLIQRALEIMK
jgi:RHS repeat-associated protein